MGENIESVKWHCFSETCITCRKYISITLYHCIYRYLTLGEYNSTSLALLLAQITYLAILFILQLVHTASSVRLLGNK